MPDVKPGDHAVGGQISRLRADCSSLCGQQHIVTRIRSRSYRHVIDMTGVGGTMDVGGTMEAAGTRDVVGRMGAAGMMDAEVL